MAGIKAGTAYVAIELAGVQSLRRQISNQVTSALRDAGAAGSDELARRISGRQAVQRLRNDIQAGLRDTAGIFRPFVSSMSDILRSSGATAARNFSSEFSRGISGVRAGGSFSGFIDDMRFIGSFAGGQIVSSLGNGMRNLPSVLSSSLQSGISAVRNFASAAGNAMTVVGNSIVRLGGHLGTLGRQIGFASYQMQAMGVISSLVFTAPVIGVGILGTAIGVKFAAQIEDATIALKALLPAGYNVADLVKRLQQIAIQSPVFDSASVVQFTQRMVAAGIEIGKTERFIKAFGNIAVTVGIPMDKVTLALQAFSQMAGKGVVNMEELRQQLGDALPGALKIAADGLGVTQAQLFKLVKEGKVNANDLLNAFIKVGESGVYLQGAATGADSLRSRWNQLVETVQSKLANAILNNMDSIKNSFDKVMPSVDVFLGAFISFVPTIVGWFGTFVEKIAQLITWYKNLSSENQNLVKILAIVAVAGGPIMAILGTLGTAIAGIASGLSLILTPAGAVVAAIIAAAIAGKFLYDWLVNLYNSSESFRSTIDRIVSSFKSNLLPIIMEFVGVIKNSLLKSWETIKEAFNNSKGSFEGIKTIFKAIGAILVVVIAVAVGILGGVLKAIGPVIAAIVSFVVGLVQIIGGIISFIVNLFTGNFSALGDDLKTIWNGIWNAIFMTVYNLGLAIWNFISGFVQTIIGFFTFLWDVLVGHSIVPDMINAIVDWFKSLPGRVIAFVSSLVTSVISFFFQLGFKAGQTVRELVLSVIAKFGQLKEGFSNIVRAVVSKVGDMLSEMAKIPGKVLNALGNLGSLLYNAGRDIISGLIRGITDMAGSLMNKAKSIADNVKNTISNALDINSPSRVMMGIGRSIVEGLSKGITGSMMDVRSAMEATAATIIAPVTLATAPVEVSLPSDVRSGSGLTIENYYASENDDPATQAEKWAWINSTRGWAA